jgi:hypothetical protein
MLLGPPLVMMRVMNYAQAWALCDRFTRRDRHEGRAVGGQRRLVAAWTVSALTVALCTFVPLMIINDESPAVGLVYAVLTGAVVSGITFAWSARWLDQSGEYQNGWRLAAQTLSGINMFLAWPLWFVLLVLMAFR